MTTYVLVPGFWLGAWAWRPVTRRLRAAGHEVHPVTLTGLGERAHLARPDIDLDTHATDIANVMAYEDLRDVVLVAHSGGGLPVAMVADRIPERLSRVVYVDSGELPDGMAQLDVDPDARAAAEQQIAAAGDGWRVPPPDWHADAPEFTGLDAAARDLLTGRSVAQPALTASQPLRRTPTAATEALPKTLVACTFPAQQVRALTAQGHPAFAALAGPQWTLRELPTGHWPMLSRPDDLADLLANES